LVASHDLSFSVKDLHNGLGLTGISSARLLGTLHQTVLLNELCVRLLSKFFTFVGNFEFLGDDTKAFRTV
jgi:hypothetical protein